MTAKEARVGMRVRHKRTWLEGVITAHRAGFGDVCVDIGGSPWPVFLKDFDRVVAPDEILEATIAAFARGKEQVAV